MSGKTFVRRRGMTPIPNATVYDTQLSYAALGVLTVLLGRPENAPQGYRDLMGRGLGKDALLRALRELNEAGYRHQVRRSGKGGRLVTDTVVSETPITQEQAEQWLTRSAALTRTARRKSAHGPTSSDAPSSQVAPCGGSPEPGPPEPGHPPHNPTGSKVSYSLRSYSPGDTNAADCEHGDPRGLELTPAGQPRCPLCRREPRHLAAVPDAKTRAAGDDR